MISLEGGQSFHFLERRHITGRMTTPQSRKVARSTTQVAASVLAQEPKHQPYIEGASLSVSYANGEQHERPNPIRSRHLAVHQGQLESVAARGPNQLCIGSVGVLMIYIARVTILSIMLVTLLVRYWLMGLTKE